MTNTCNCSTCPHNIRTVNRKGYKKCKISDWILDKDYQLIEHMEKVGCLSHPSAREWLMRDVIKELERLESLHDINKTNDPEEIGLSIAYGIAITLIKNGVNE